MGGVQGPVLSTIAEEEENFDLDTKSVDSAQKDIDWYLHGAP